MRWPRLLGFFLLSGAIAALVGGFFAGVLIALLEVGPVAWLPAGFLSALFGLRLMALPAAVPSAC